MQHLEHSSTGGIQQHGIGLPEYCYSRLASSGEIVILKRGEPGYYKTDIPVADRDTAKELVKHYNDKLGVTKPQYPKLPTMISLRR